MEYRQIVAVTGLPGLFQLMSTKNDGAIVKSLADKSLKFVSARIHHLTPLESIEIYTTGDNVRLHEVFEMIEKDDTAAIKINSDKDNKAAKALFKKILPDFDEDRVYTSDIKKVFKWYAILKENDLLHFDYLKAQPEEQVQLAEKEAEKTNDANDEESTKSAPTVSKTASKTKAVAKKTADEMSEKPAKKAPAKKKAAGTKVEEKPKKLTPKKKTDS